MRDGLRLRSVGRVRGDRIVLHKRYAPALDGITGFSHLFVLYALDRARPARLRLHPMGRRELPVSGVFATRSPRRPNPIALTIVRLRGRRGRELAVEGLDAWDGSPVLDLKPFDRKDVVRRPVEPVWRRRVRFGRKARPLQ